MSPLIDEVAESQIHQVTVFNSLIGEGAESQIHQVTVFNLTQLPHFLIVFSRFPGIPQRRQAT